MSEKEDLKKDFSGLEALKVISSDQLNKHLAIAGVCGVRMEYKIVPSEHAGESSKKVELWSEKDADLTEFWSKLII